jgi:hypothetical protein
MAPRMPSAHPTSHRHWSSAIRLALTTIHAPMSFVTSSSVEIAPISLGEGLNGDSEGGAENTFAGQWFGRLRRVLHPLLQRGQLGVRWVRCQPSRRASSALGIWNVSATMKWPLAHLTVPLWAPEWIAHVLPEPICLSSNQRPGFRSAGWSLADNEAHLVAMPKIIWRQAVTWGTAEGCTSCQRPVQR